MKLAICCDGQKVEDRVSSVFGRCAYLLVVDTEKDNFKSVANPHLESQSGIGVKVAQWVVDSGADALVSGDVGPKAAAVLAAAGVAVHRLTNLSAAAARARLLSETAP